MVLKAARITLTSACAVGSRSRVVVLNPLTRIAPSLTITAPYGQSPSVDCSMAMRM